MRKPSVLVIFLTVFIDLIGFGIVLPLLPIYNRDLGASGLLIGVIQASFSAMQFLFAPDWAKARAADQHSRGGCLLRDFCLWLRVARLTGTVDTAGLAHVGGYLRRQ